MADTEVLLVWPADSRHSALSPLLGKRTSMGTGAAPSPSGRIGSGDSLASQSAAPIRSEDLVCVREEYVQSDGIRRDSDAVSAVSSANSFCDSVKSSTEDAQLSGMASDDDMDDKSNKGDATVDDAVPVLKSTLGRLGVDKWICINVLLVLLAIALDWRFFRGIVEQLLTSGDRATPVEPALAIESASTSSELTPASVSFSSALVVFISRGLARVHNGRAMFEFIDLHLTLFQALIVETIVKSAKAMAEAKVAAEEVLLQAMSFRDGLLLYIALFVSCLGLGLLGMKLEMNEMKRARRAV